MSIDVGFHSTPNGMELDLAVRGMNLEDAHRLGEMVADAYVALYASESLDENGKQELKTLIIPPNTKGTCS